VYSQNRTSSETTEENELDLSTTLRHTAELKLNRMQTVIPRNPIPTVFARVTSILFPTNFQLSQIIFCSNAYNHPRIGVGDKVTAEGKSSGEGCPLLYYFPFRGEANCAALREAPCSSSQNGKMRHWPLHLPIQLLYLHAHVIPVLRRLHANLKYCSNGTIHV